ncbi:MAG: 30S ribosomal protein S27ae [Euryarchaeota archaeon]|nr:30S ribosomal protein S27ae [Euryarchaeota archaeon]
MSKRQSLYEVNDGKLVRKNQSCPQCGPGVFLAKHANRSTCGRCGWDAAETTAAPEPVATEAPIAEVATEEE